MAKLVLTVFLVLVTLFHSLQASKILFILPMATRSETHLFIPLAKELALRGHSITFVSPVQTNLQIKTFRELTPLSPLDFSDFDQEPNPLEARRKIQQTSKLSWIMSSDFSFVTEGCHTVFKNPDFQQLYKESFDLLFFSANFNNCFEGLVHLFKAPFISFSSMPVMGDIVEMTGMRMPTSFVPNSFFEYTDRMTFKERLVNTGMNWLFSIMYHGVMGPMNTELYRQYLGQDFPEMVDIERNISLLFSNSHFSLNTPRPTLPNVVEIGGIHCQDPKPLPQELDKWLSDSKDGFIFFSMGSVIKGITLPEETRKMFLNVFSRLKQRVLWKWETEQMSDLPKNVRLGKWLPQQDVLGHKNIKLFMSHGGLLSTQETIYHGVPIVGIPMFVDQNVNMKQAEQIGFAITLEILEMTEEILENAIRKIIGDPKYMKKAKEISHIFRDRPHPPLQTAVFWTEYVLKHKGASHIQSVARELNFVQYHSLDVVGFFTSILMLVAYVNITIFKWCWCRKESRSNINMDNKKRQ